MRITGFVIFLVILISCLPSLPQLRKNLVYLNSDCQPLNQTSICYCVDPFEPVVKHDEYDEEEGEVLVTRL